MYQGPENIIFEEKKHSLIKYNIFKKENVTESFKEFNYIDSLKDIARHASLNLPEEISEIFIDFEYAPVFLTFNTPLNKVIDDFFSSGNYIDNIEEYNTIKELYFKWSINRIESEKWFYVQSIIKLINKNKNKNFLYFLYEGIIYAYDRNLYDLEKSLALIEQAKDFVNLNLIDSDYDVKKLNYLICLYEGFINLKGKNNFNALEAFNTALNYKQYGINAQYYIALVNSNINNVVENERFIKNLLKYDMELISFAINSKSIALLNFFIQKSYLLKIFINDAFAENTSILDSIFNFGRQQKLNYFEQLREKFDKFSHINTIKEFFNEEIERDLTFINKCFNSGLKGNTLFVYASENFNSLFENCIKNIHEQVKERFYNEIKDKFVVYDQQMDDKKLQIERLKLEIDNSRTRIIKKMNEDLEDMEKQITSEINLFENKINNIHLEKNIDPKSSFGNALTYNLIISSVVFLMGSTAGYSTISSGYTDFNEMFVYIIGSGFKWSAITFLIGLLFGFLMSGLAFVERSNTRQKYIQRISSLKNYREKKFETIRKDSDLEIKNALKSIEERISKAEIKIVELNDQKTKHFNDLKAEVEKKISEATTELAIFLE